jgi:hypothetical protein
MLKTSVPLVYNPSCSNSARTATSDAILAFWSSFKSPGAINFKSSICFKIFLSLRARLSGSTGGSAAVVAFLA